MIHIVPALLARTHTELHDIYLSLGHAAPHLHLDVADGTMTESILFSDPSFIADHIETETLEMHIMTRHPARTIEAFAHIPHITKVICMAESEDHEEALARAEDAGWSFALSINPNTPVHAIEGIASRLAGIQIMGVRPGTQGAPWIPEMLERAAYLHATYPHLPLSWDGGATRARLPHIAASGITTVCVGSAICEASDPQQAYNAFVDAAAHLTPISALC
jgi:ribulose-phosphate 3-epimerase